MCPRVAARLDDQTLIIGHTCPKAATCDFRAEIRRKSKQAWA